jgi:hypothetical protein
VLGNERGERGRSSRWPAEADQHPRATELGQVGIRVVVAGRSAIRYDRTDLVPRLGEEISPEQKGPGRTIPGGRSLTHQIGGAARRLPPQGATQHHELRRCAGRKDPRRQPNSHVGDGRVANTESPVCQLPGIRAVATRQGERGGPAVETSASENCHGPSRIPDQCEQLTLHSRHEVTCRDGNPLEEMKRCPGVGCYPGFAEGEPSGNCRQGVTSLPVF